MATREIKIAMVAGAVAMGVGRFLTVRWCREDVKRRCRRPVLVMLAVAALFPLGPLAWLAWRPEVIGELVEEEVVEGAQGGCVCYADPVCLAA